MLEQRKPEFWVDDAHEYGRWKKQCELGGCQVPGWILYTFFTLILG